METTEHKIYSCLAEIAKMDRIALILSTQAPTPELLLEFLQSVIAVSAGLKGNQFRRFKRAPVTAPAA